MSALRLRDRCLMQAAVTNRQADGRVHHEAVGPPPGPFQHRRRRLAPFFASRRACRMYAVDSEHRTKFLNR